jgi:MFS family permease
MWEDLPSANSLTIAHTIQLAVAPVFLLSGLGMLLNLFALRLARSVDRSRTLEAAFAAMARDERRRAVAELKILDRRTRLIFASIALATVSSMAVCLVVSLMFVSRLIGGGFGHTIAGLFILAMALLVAALGLFLVEVYQANASVQRRNDLIEHGLDEGGI